VNQNSLPSSLVRFEAELGGAIRRQRSRRPRQLATRTVLVAATATAVALGVFSALPGGAPSVVDRAAAALAPGDGSVLHIVMTGTSSDFGGAPVSVRVETWQDTTAPYNSREVMIAGDQRFETGTSERGVQLYDFVTNTVYVSATATKPDTPNDGSAKTGATSASPANQHVDRYREKILSLLQSGKLHEDGHVTVGGRAAIRIVSDDGRVVLTVDASTYEPIDWRVSDGGRTAVAEFSAYEKLAATDANEALTSVVAQHPDATVDTDPAHYDAVSQRLNPKKAAFAQRGGTSQPEPKKTNG